jgi:hypothetical protein
VHVSIPKAKLKRIRAMAELDHRSLSAQVAWLVDRALEEVPLWAQKKSEGGSSHGSISK